MGARAARDEMVKCRLLLIGLTVILIFLLALLDSITYGIILKSRYQVTPMRTGFRSTNCTSSFHESDEDEIVFREAMDFEDGDEYEDDNDVAEEVTDDES